MREPIPSSMPPLCKCQSPKIGHLHPCPDSGSAGTITGQVTDGSQLSPTSQTCAVQHRDGDPRQEAACSSALGLPPLLSDAPDTCHLLGDAKRSPS